MELTILGNNSAVPAFGRHPTCQLLRIEGQQIMIDCGEGAQIQMQKFGLRIRNLNHILISHLHGDHYFGLPGLINTMSLNGRTAPLNLYAPKDLIVILKKIFEVADSTLNYELNFYPLYPGHNWIADHALFTIHSFETTHRIPCYGFAIASKPAQRSLDIDKCRLLQIPPTLYRHLTNGEDITLPDGQVIENATVTTQGKAPKKYAYCADTLYTESFLPAIMHADTLYHESTFIHADEEKAKLRFHSTSVQAARIAVASEAKKLLLGHFSSRYQDLSVFEQEAKQVFAHTLVTKEGETYVI